MSLTDFDKAIGTEATADKVGRWRIKQLDLLGIPLNDSVELHKHGGPYVVAEARKLVIEKGCPPEQVAAILLP